MLERELQDAVIELAALLGWRVHHVRPARTAKGWRTPVQGHTGFPDLLMVKPGSGLAPFAIELKAARGRVAEEQWEWLRALDEAGCYAAVWRPKDWLSGRIERELRTGTRAAA